MAREIPLMIVEKEKATRLSVDGGSDARQLRTHEVPHLPQSALYASPHLLVLQSGCTAYSTNSNNTHVWCVVEWGSARWRYYSM